MEQENPINPQVINWFRARKISPEVVAHMGIYSGRHLTTGDGFKVEPDPQGNIIAFPYLRGGKAVNAKYRAQGKRFYQPLGGTACFWNSDILSDPSLTDGRNALVIVEGEMDALSLIEAGYPFVVSVPNGAPPARRTPDGVHVEGIDDDVDDDRFQYIILDWERLKKIKRIVLATDADEPGKRLAEELVRRLGRVRCSFITYNDDCKDFNEVLSKHGPSAINEIIHRAKSYPVSGIYTLSELPAEPDLVAVSTGWGRLDQFLMPFYPALMVVTGFANGGKSTWVNQLIAQLAYRHGWKAAIASFEMRIRPFVTGTLGSVKRERSPGADDIEIDHWIDKNFVFIAPEPGDEDENYDIDWLIDKATAAVIRHGVRVLVIDPWNEIEHAVWKKESLTDYTGRSIRALKRFGREFECLVIVVAHPTKRGAEKNAGDVTLYDISDSAHFANKADFGVVVARVHDEVTKMPTMISNIMVKKVRYQPDSGQIGTVDLVYNPTNRIFSQ